MSTLLVYPEKRGGASKANYDWLGCTGFKIKDGCRKQVSRRARLCGVFLEEIKGCGQDKHL